MKEQLLRVAMDAPIGERKNLAREFLQARILLSMQRCGAMVPLSFHGGTALRFLFDLDRFSEDLDFSLADAETYRPELIVRRVEDDLRREGYEVDVQWKDDKVVHAGWIRFPGLPHELGTSGQVSEMLRIKWEVDTRPPAGTVHEVTLVRRHAVLRIHHHDRASLLAGKLHAVLQRPYVKGRDLYDLAWYLADRRWPEPNLSMLRASLEQTGWGGEAPSESNWRRLVRERLREIDLDRAVLDVEPFLENPEARDWLTLDSLLRLLADP